MTYKKIAIPRSNGSTLLKNSLLITQHAHDLPFLRVIFSEYQESEDTHEKSIFLLFHQNIPLGELIQGKIVLSSNDLFYGQNLRKFEICI